LRFNGSLAIDGSAWPRASDAAFALTRALAAKPSPAALDTLPALLGSAARPTNPTTHTSPTSAGNRRRVRRPTSEAIKGTLSTPYVANRTNPEGDVNVTGWCG
jgi:hypothetical protein